jgi:hypothetical protein
MAANQRVGIISKYAKNLGMLPMLPMQSLPLAIGSSVAPSSYASAVPTAVAAAQSFTSGVSTMFSSGQSSGGYVLQFLFFLFLYGFILFLLLLLIHYTIRPMFQFVPGGKGIIPLSTTNDYNIYWNNGEQPTTAAPDRTAIDTLNSVEFRNNYSLSVDIYLKTPSTYTGLDRLIFYASSAVFNPTDFVFNYAKSITDNIADTAETNTARNVCMICYINDNTNDLIVTYFLKNGIQKSSSPIQNIPLNTPFRITIVYDTNIFTVYFNGVQVSQTAVGVLTATGLDLRQTGKMTFYANTRPTKCGYVQTLLLWNRPIQYPELAALPVALTPMAKFVKDDSLKEVPTSGAQCIGSPSST